MQTENDDKGFFSGKEKLKYALYLSLLLGVLVAGNKLSKNDIGAAFAHAMVVFIFTLPISYLVMMVFSKKIKKDIEKGVEEIDANRLATMKNIGVNGFTRLMAASVNVDLGEIKNFVNEGDDVNAIDEKGYTALMYAASNGRLESVQLLIVMGADKTIRTSKGNDAFYFADNKNHLEVKKFLAS